MRALRLDSLSVMRFVAIALLASLLAGCQAGFMRSLKVPHVFSAYEKQTIAYGAHSDQRMDVYRPSAKKYIDQQRPMIVFLFGGSWRNGERSWYEFFAARYALKGYVVIVPDYRKASDFVYPSFMEDAARAVAKSIEIAPQLSGNPKQLVLMGHSAGAHIGALLSLNPKFLQRHQLSPQVFSAFVGLSGPYDFLPMTDPLVVEVFNGDANLPASQPINFAANGKLAPPMLLVHGAKDELVWPKNSINLAHAINAAGGSATTLVLDDIGHVRTLFQAGSGLRWLAPEVEPAVDRFLQQHLFCLGKTCSSILSETPVH
jgi:acetyl esterase/lipase